MRIVMIGSEAWPFAKAGGLGDVLGSLPAALARNGLEVTVVIPWYTGIDAEPAGQVTFSFEGRADTASFGRVWLDGVEFLFVALDDFKRDQLYGYDDDVRRFVRFASAAWSLAAARAPDVLHLHDWQAALVASLRESSGVRMPTVTTVHNLGYQGRLTPAELYRWTDVSPELFHMAGLEYYGDANLLKGAIVYSDVVTTVSPRYAEEIQTEAFGCGLDPVLRHHAGKLRGILNGIDTRKWNPASDRQIAGRYSATDPSGKVLCVRALQKELELDGPILGVVSRLVDQKGIDLVADAAAALVKAGWALAIVGSGDSGLEKRLSALAQAHPGFVAFRPGYDEMLAHRIYAGARGFLIPSRYEPCGLTQMIAMRYGAIPVARAVGGLADTITDGKTGFLFEEASSAALIEAVAMLSSADLSRMVRRSMSADFSWDRAAAEYFELYRELRASA